MVRIGWERQPLLLFSDVHRIGLESKPPPTAPLTSTTFKWDSRKGILSYCIFPKMVLLIKLSWCSAPSRGKRGEHAMWKHAQPLSTDFAWLLEDLAQAFCSLACARIKLACMVRSTRYSWDLMNIIRLGYISRDYITWARPGASLESSAKCWQRGFVLDVVYNRTKPWPTAATGPRKTLRSYTTTDATHAG